MVTVNGHLATAIDEDYRGKLTSIATRVYQSRDSEAILESLVAVDEDEIQYKRIGAEVHAKIHCGKQTAAYVMFGDVVEFLYRHVWF